MTARSPKGIHKTHCEQRSIARTLSSSLSPLYAWAEGTELYRYCLGRWREQVNAFKSERCLEVRSEAFCPVAYGYQSQLAEEKAISLCEARQGSILCPQPAAQSKPQA